jgi:hypothetical protein
MNGINDGNSGGEFPKVRAADKVGDEGIHGKRAQREWAEQNDAGMRSGGIFAQIGELDIEGQEHSVFMTGGASDLSIGSGEEIFVGRGQHVVTQFNQFRFEMPGEILIQLELHSSVPVFQTLS